jgi:hypothetical protein
VNQLLTTAAGSDGIPNTADDVPFAVCLPAPDPNQPELPLCPGAGTYRVMLLENEEADANLLADSDWLLRLEARGASAAVETTLLTDVELVPETTTVFDYPIVAWRVNLDGNAVLGRKCADLGNPPGCTDNFMRMYILSHGNRNVNFFGLEGEPLVTTAMNKVYAEEIQFYNQQNKPLSDLCSRCEPQTAANPVFRGPDAAPYNGVPQYDLQAPQLERQPLDLEPYYLAAKAQESTDGKATHHLRGPVGTKHVIDCNTHPDFAGGFTGLIYVERGNNLEFKGKCVINGTIAHEGMSWIDTFDPITNTTTRTVYGYLTLNQASLRLDSYGTTDPNTGKYSGFAPGLAIAGAPILAFQKNPKHSVHIKGFVMGGNYIKVDDKATSSFIASDNGIIEGGVFGVFGVWGEDNLDGPYWKGPQDEVYSGAVGYWIHQMRIGGGANVLFLKPPETPPGFPPMMKSDTRPTIKAWRSL